MKDNLLRISVSVEKEPYEQMRNIANKQNISIGLAIRMAIEDFLTENNDEDYVKESIKDSSMQISKRTKEGIKKDWNRNVFSLRTSDEASTTIKNYCKENKITVNSFLLKLIDDFFGKPLSKSKNILEENLQRISVSVVKEHYEQIKKISDTNFISSGLIIRKAIDKFLSAKSSENTKKEPLIKPIRANLEKSNSQIRKSNQSEEDIFVKLEKLITYMNNGTITEKEFKILKSKLFEF